MIRLSLTDFVDIVSKSGIPKATKVSQIKSRDDYEPAFDFYKPLRDHIIAVHSSDGTRDSIADVMGSIVDRKKVDNYPSLIAGYQRWWGRKAFHWFNPSSDSYVANEVEVNVNPELGLRFNGARHLIKLYFKAEPLSKQKVDIITYLMEKTLRPVCGHREIIMSILDIRNSKLISYDGKTRVTDGMINAELGYVANLWETL